jgi:hypothetical protein
MGREIRRVPAGWEHPRNGRGHYIPLFDESYGDALRDYESRRTEWDNGEGERVAKEYDCHSFEDWEGSPPDRDYYREEWTDEEATHYQVYENVSEGTPTSPVFANLQELEDWLVEQGYSRTAARRFCEQGYVLSMMIHFGESDTEIKTGIDMLDAD